MIVAAQWCPHRNRWFHWGECPFVALVEEAIRAVPSVQIDIWDFMATEGGKT